MLFYDIFYWSTSTFSLHGLNLKLFIAPHYTVTSPSISCQFAIKEKFCCITAKTIIYGGVAFLSRLKHSNFPHNWIQTFFFLSVDDNVCLLILFETVSCWTRKTFYFDCLIKLMTFELCLIQSLNNKMCDLLFYFRIIDACTTRINSIISSYMSSINFYHDKKGSKWSDEKLCWKLFVQNFLFVLLLFLITSIESPTSKRRQGRTEKEQTCWSDVLAS